MTDNLEQISREAEESREIVRILSPLGKLEENGGVDDKHRIDVLADVRNNLHSEAMYREPYFIALKKKAMRIFEPKFLSLKEEYAKQGMLSESSNKFVGFCLSIYKHNRDKQEILMDKLEEILRRERVRADLKNGMSMALVGACGVGYAFVTSVLATNAVYSSKFLEACGDGAATLCFGALAALAGFWAKEPLKEAFRYSNKNGRNNFRADAMMNLQGAQ